MKIITIIQLWISELIFKLNILEPNFISMSCLVFFFLSDIIWGYAQELHFVLFSGIICSRAWRKHYVVAGDKLMSCFMKKNSREGREAADNEENEE